MPAQVLAIRAKTIIPLTGEGAARGVRLFAALKKIDNAVLLVRDGLVLDVLPWKNVRLPAGAQVRDVGEVCLIPACVNAHAHIQLSWLGGRTRWGQGFTPWLASMIPLLSTATAAEVAAAAESACESIAATGTLHVGDVAGSLRGGVALVDRICQEAGLGVSHFCEWFGFAPPFIDDERPWPPRCRDELAAQPELATRCAPAGHALYSTEAKVLRAAREYCASRNTVFSFHLAESPEESRLLLSGDGPLYDCYEGVVLPESWRAPGMRPLAYAASLDLLGPGTLAVHGVHLDAQEVDVLAASGTALCLCPRSNRNLQVGAPPVRALMESGCLLCLGTDGLTSNTDLDVRQEAMYLRESLDVPPEALVRMLTVNGAEALGLDGGGCLTPGSLARFCLLPEALTY